MTGVEQRRRWPEAEATGERPAHEAAAVDGSVARPLAPRLLVVVALVLAAAWIAALVVGIAAASPPGGPGALRIAAWIGLGSGPLALLATLALLLLRTGAREATAYSRAAAGLRAESESLAEMLGLLTRRIESARAGLAEQSGALAALGEDAGVRLLRAGDTLRQQAASVAATAATLDDSAAAARTDLGVLLADLPQAEALATALSERLRLLGGESHAQAETLTQRIATLETAARGADQASVGAARRLAAELERVEGGAAAVDRRIGEATGRIEQASLAALEGSAEALERVRRGIEAQGAAFAATLAQAQGGAESSGTEARQRLAAQIADLSQSSAAIAAQLHTHGETAAQVVARIEEGLRTIETRFTELGARGAEQTASIGSAVEIVAEHARQLGVMLGESGDAAETLAGRAEAIRGHVAATGDALGDAIPAALSRVRLQAEQGLRPIADAQPRAEALAALAGAIGYRLATFAPLLEGPRQALGQLGDAAQTRLAETTAQADAFQRLLGTTDAQLRAITDGATVQLVDALLRVRDTATQAAERAREALGSAIPDAARQLGEQSAQAMREAIARVGETQVAALGDTSNRAVEAASAAAERLSRQLVTIADTAAQIEARTAAADEQGFARQMGLLIEALNSSAIDIAKIFSNAPTDTAWAAYLRGDRGVFTRRAVHLLEAGEARTIAARYGDDPEFREQVNRYVHDFEAMLRRVLAVREGGPMGVTLLSSDAGKLYVLLAQAIERLRR